MMRGGGGSVGSFVWFECNSELDRKRCTGAFFDTNLVEGFVRRCYYCVMNYCATMIRLSRWYSKPNFLVNLRVTAKYF